MKLIKNLRIKKQLALKIMRICKYFYLIYRGDSKQDSGNVKNKMNNLRNNQAISSVDIYGGDDYGNILLLFLFNY